LGPRELDIAHARRTVVLGGMSGRDMWRYRTSMGGSKGK